MSRRPAVPPATCAPTPSSCRGGRLRPPRSRSERQEAECFSCSSPGRTAEFRNNSSYQGLQRRAVKGPLSTHQKTNSPHNVGLQNCPYRAVKRPANRAEKQKCCNVKMCKSQFRKLQRHLPYILVLTPDEWPNWLPLRGLKAGKAWDRNRPLGLSAVESKLPPFDPQAFPQAGGVPEEASQT